MKNKKILTINVMYPPDIGGGAEIVMHDLNKILLQRGFSVSALVFHEEYKPKKDSVNGIDVWRFPIPNIYLPHVKKKRNTLLKMIWHFLNIYNFRSNKIFKKIINEFKPDLLIIHNTYGWSSSILFTIADYNIPTIQVLHDLHYICYRNMFKGYENCTKQCLFCKFIRYPYKRGSNNITAVVGVSNFTLRKHLAHGYFSNVKFKKVIYNARIMNANTKINFKKSDNRISFGYIGSIAANKGIEILLEAFSNLKNHHNLLLYIAGSGDQNYIEYLQNKYNDNKIFWLGFVSPEKFYPMIDLLIVPSIWYENFGIVIIEANYFGKPVIASNIGGIPEIVKPGINGYLFTPKKSDELTNRLLEFINNIDYWRKKSEEIHNYSKYFVSTKRWGDEWEELINMVLLESK
ncbi:MAG: glycosyltransferase family 4 protein [Candidatus Aenigmatarchaeota archaeon]